MGLSNEISNEIIEYNVIKITTMDKKRYIGIILFIVGVIVAAIGSLWQSSWNEVTSIAISGPYANTVGVVGLAVLMVAIYFLTWPVKGKR